MTFEEWLEDLRVNDPEVLEEMKGEDPVAIYELTMALTKESSREELEDLAKRKIRSKNGNR